MFGGNANTKAAFKNCHPFTKSKIHLNDKHVEDADNLDLIMNMYNLIEYSDSYSDSTDSLCQYKRQGPLENNTNLTDASPTFKYKSSLLGDSTEVVEGTNPSIPLAQRLWKNAQIIVPLKYISLFFRSLELPLIDTKLYIQLDYTKNFVISNSPGVTTFKITKAELYVPVVTLKTEDNNKLNQLLDSKFERIVYWNEYKSKIEDITKTHNDNDFKRIC